MCWVRSSFVLYSDNVTQWYILCTYLAVEEVLGDVVFKGVGNDGANAVEFVDGELTGTLVEVDLGHAADLVGEATADTTDGGEGVHDLLAAIHVGVQHTDDVLKVGRDHERRHGDEVTLRGERGGKGTSGVRGGGAEGRRFWSFQGVE